VCTAEWGFTGDWYIGVVTTSVSVSLGERLVKMLCNDMQEHKRLESGVGLPTSLPFYEQRACSRRGPAQRSRSPISRPSTTMRGRAVA